MMFHNPPDQHAREAALNVNQSFIVQAPAGSGKTELLTRRYIALLETVRNPEEIIAITFTRKAAAEMRHRILSKINHIDPSRLRIMTIDALCGFLVSQMPLKSALPQGFSLLENAENFYTSAIENGFLYHQDPFLKEFLLYLDNDLSRVKLLCTDMLKNRDQWLPHIFKWNYGGFNYTPDQKKFLEGLSPLLKLLTAELKLLFEQQQQYDFIEIALRALEALGDEENPTDLALKLDYQIKHLLVDEFQDTSATQWRLLQKMITGWEPNDGRTLFFVGDPMQSIYRFRKAEVGLFLEVQKKGICQLPLTPLTLTSNFRSEKPLISWFNEHFPAIFQGEIAYSPSSTIHENNENEKAVFYHPIDNSESNHNEAQQVLSIIKKKPQHKIAILVRARTHLKDIIALLDQHHISYRAVELTNLSEHPLVQDLFSLTRALFHPADRIAWLAVLRAPWCGLTLEELHTLAADDHEKTIFELMQSSSLSSPRFLHVKNILQNAIKKMGKISAREWVENTWLELKGKLTLSNPSALKIAYQYFNLLDQTQDISEIEKKLQSLSVTTNSHADVNVEVMTIHKAKGLEFDVVILPGLERYTRGDPSKLFLWEERLNKEGNMELWVAPIRSAEEKSSDIYDYLKEEENRREEEELQRLFYVAATRAKKNLHLLFSINFKNPAKRSFLQLLWPAIKNQFTLSERVKKTKMIFETPMIKRLPESVFSSQIVKQVS